MNGLVFRINDDIFMSLIDFEKETISDGIPISEGVYTTLQDNQISYIEIEISDGNKPIKIDDIDEFAQNFYDNENIFYKIKDIMIYGFDISIEELYNTDSKNFIKYIITKIKTIKNEKKFT